MRWAALLFVCESLYVFCSCLEAANLLRQLPQQHVSLGSLNIDDRLANARIHEHCCNRHRCRLTFT